MKAISDEGNHCQSIGVQVCARGGEGQEGMRERERVRAPHRDSEARAAGPSALARGCRRRRHSGGGKSQSQYCIYIYM